MAHDLRRLPFGSVFHATSMIMIRTAERRSVGAALAYTVKRVPRATGQALRVALGAGLACLILCVGDPHLRDRGFICVVLLPAAWFAVAFTVVFSLALFFPAAYERIQFPRARKLVSVLIGLLAIAAVSSLVWKP
jgi:hypothetical protein